MRTIQTRTAAALLIVAGSIVPAFAQGRGNGRVRGNERDDRPQQQRDSRGEDRRGGGQQFRQRDAQPQYQDQQGNWPQQNYGQQQYRPQNNDRPQQQRDLRGEDRRGGGQQFRQRNAQPQYQERQGNWPQQSYGQQQYRPQNNDRRGGSSFEFRSGGGLRWADRGGYRGRFIPQNRFNSLFGRQHFFRSGRPVYYNGFPQFSYGGYAFQILDPLPAYWGQDWYDSDDVYVEYQDDGYYMYNRSYPDVGIAVSINF